MSDFDFDFDFRSGDGEYRRPGCGCAVAIAFAFLIVFAIAWLVAHRRQVELVAIVALLALAAYLARDRLAQALQWFRRPRASADPSTMPTPLANVRVGPVHTAGLVGFTGGGAHHAPLGAPPCVFFRIIIEPVDHPGAAIFEGRSADEIVLE